MPAVVAVLSRTERGWPTHRPSPRPQAIRIAEIFFLTAERTLLIIHPPQDSEEQNLCQQSDPNSGFFDWGVLGGVARAFQGCRKRMCTLQPR